MHIQWFEKTMNDIMTSPPSFPLDPGWFFPSSDCFLWLYGPARQRDVPLLGAPASRGRYQYEPPGCKLPWSAAQPRLRRGRIDRRGPGAAQCCIGRRQRGRDPGVRQRVRHRRVPRPLQGRALRSRPRAVNHASAALPEVATWACSAGGRKARRRTPAPRACRLERRCACAAAGGGDYAAAPKSTDSKCWWKLVKLMVRLYFCPLYIYKSLKSRIW